MEEREREKRERERESESARERQRARARERDREREGEGEGERERETAAAHTSSYEDPLWRTEAAVKPKSLNEDPFNASRQLRVSHAFESCRCRQKIAQTFEVLAEEQAVEACKVGFEVATELLETAP